MSHFAKVENGVVTKVIVAEQDAINSGAFGDPAAWVQTSYNTFGGVHYGQNRKPDGGVALRKNYAARGYIYDAERDAFIPPKPYPSWILDEEKCWWMPPIPYPFDGKTYVWHEPTASWVQGEQPGMVQRPPAPPPQITGG